MTLLVHKTFAFSNVVAWASYKGMVTLLSQLVIHSLLVDYVVHKVAMSLLELNSFIINTLLHKYWGMGLIQRRKLQHETSECCPTNFTN